jgi:hypothetical protein
MMSYLTQILLSLICHWQSASLSPPLTLPSACHHNLTIATAPRDGGALAVISRRHHSFQPLRSFLTAALHHHCRLRVILMDFHIGRAL